mmetsp:Transcript_24521/g.79266  ORF Transcript_24521/g.79266 Transcript_24521/m.79266 type:complete len:244 (-) Transcript_24521:905-1636(-)
MSGGSSQQPSPRLTLWIPVEQVGIVIGRSGGTVNKIQSSSGSRLNVVPSEANGSSWAPVYIKGGDVFGAAKQVEDLVEEVDDAVLEFPLTSKQRNALKGGSPAEESLCYEAKRVSAEFSVRIRVPPGGSDKKDLEPATLEGPLAVVAEAHAAVLALAGAGGGPNKQQHHHQKDHHNGPDAAAASTGHSAKKGDPRLALKENDPPPPPAAAAKADEDEQRREKKQKKKKKKKRQQRRRHRKERF